MVRSSAVRSPFSQQCLYRAPGFTVPRERCWPAILWTLQKSWPCQGAQLVWQSPSTTLAGLGDNPFPQGSQFIFPSPTHYPQSKMLDYQLPASRSPRDCITHVSEMITTPQNKVITSKGAVYQITFLAVQFDSPWACKTSTPLAGLAAAVSIHPKRLKK